MREELAKLVDPVLTYGIRLRDLLVNQEGPDFRTAQKELQGKLQLLSQAKRFEGGLLNPAGSSVTGSDHFLGLRYPLVCWLDEIFIDSPWAREWNEHKLEQGLYGTTDRAWKFWEQARKAESLGPDVLEVFYLCVMLGFRGELRDTPDRLKVRTEGMKAQIDQAQEEECALPAALQPATNVPPLTGAARLQRMIVIGSVCLLATVFAGVFLLVLRGFGPQ
jgi:type VI secretion system protein ImpK